MRLSANISYPVAICIYAVAGFSSAIRTLEPFANSFKLVRVVEEKHHPWRAIFTKHPPNRINADSNTE